MNESIAMYTIKPIISFPEHIALPKCMYTMKNIQKLLTICDSKITEKTMPPTISEQVKKLLKCPLPEVCILESRQEAILEQLSQLKKQMAVLRLELGQSTPVSRVRRTTSTCSSVQTGAIHDIVINASPEHPPFSILALHQLWGETLKLRISCHVHSSISQLPPHLATFQLPAVSSTKSAPLLNITVIWKDVGADAELVVSPLKHVAFRGEVNILRYMMRLGPPQFNYELTDDPAAATVLDGVMDACYLASRSSCEKELQVFLELLEAYLGSSNFLFGRKAISMADVAAWSLLRQLGCKPSQNIAAWLRRCSGAVKLDA